MEALVELEIVGRHVQSLGQHLQRLRALPFLDAHLGVGQGAAAAVLFGGNATRRRFIHRHVTQRALILEHGIAHHGAHHHTEVAEQQRRDGHQHHPRQTAGEHVDHRVRRLPENEQEYPEDQITPAHRLDHRTDLVGAERGAERLVQGQANDAGRNQQLHPQRRRPEQRLAVEVGRQPDHGEGDEEDHQQTPEQAEALTIEGALQRRCLAHTLAGALDHALQVLGRDAEQRQPQQLPGRHEQAGQAQCRGEQQRPRLQAVTEEQRNALPERLRGIGRAEELQLAGTQWALRLQLRGIGVEWNAAIPEVALARRTVPGGGLCGVVTAVGDFHRQTSLLGTAERAIVGVNRRQKKRAPAGALFLAQPG